MTFTNVTQFAGWKKKGKGLEKISTGSLKRRGLKISEEGGSLIYEMSIRASCFRGEPI
jgi:hypothetical protein